MTPQKKILLASIGIVILFIVGIVYIQTHSTKIVSNVEDIVYSPEEQAVRDKVERFGNRLKNVSLLAPRETLRTELEDEYGAFLSAELLSRWQSDPTQAIGRETSSPWPDRIEILDVNRQSPNEFVVEGEVIEVTATTDEPVSSYTILMLLEVVNGDWVITQFSKGDEVRAANTVNVSGITECLPLASGAASPENSECIIGLQDTQSGTWYALDLSALPENQQSVGADVRVEIDGILVQENLRSTRWRRYENSGVITVTKMTRT